MSCKPLSDLAFVPQNPASNSRFGCCRTPGFWPVSCCCIASGLLAIRSNLSLWFRTDRQFACLQAAFLPPASTFRVLASDAPANCDPSVQSGIRSACREAAPRVAAQRSSPRRRHRCRGTVRWGRHPLRHPIFLDCRDQAGSAGHRARPATVPTFTPTPDQWAAFAITEVTTRSFEAARRTDGKIAIDDDLNTPVFSPYTGRVTQRVRQARRRRAGRASRCSPSRRASSCRRRTT